MRTNQLTRPELRAVPQAWSVAGGLFPALAILRTRKYVDEETLFVFTYGDAFHAVGGMRDHRAKGVKSNDYRKYF